MIHSKGSSSSFGDEGEVVGGGGVIHSIGSSSSKKEDGGGVNGDGVGGVSVICSINDMSSSL